MRRKITSALGLGIALFPLASMTAFAQSATATPRGATAEPMAYDVISIKPGQQTAFASRHRVTANGLSLNMTLKSLIFTAYSIQTDNQCSGLPGWAANAQFHVEAKMDADNAASLARLPQDEQYHQRQLMLQALLADRFGLKVHHETRNMRVYTLVIAKGGLKMKQSPASAMKRVNIVRGQFTGRGVTIGSLAVLLSGTLGQPVVDKTGLDGNYDVKLHWAPDDEAGSSQVSAASLDSGPSLFSALQEQLGLKLEPAREPMDTIVVDHLERPSEN